MNVDEAWKKYTDTCSAMLQRMVDDPICAKYPALRASAHLIMQQVQAYTYNTVMVPNGDFPIFNRHNYLMPIYYTANQPNPDFCYSIVHLNGRRTWKITGRRNSAHWVDLQADKGVWGDDDFGGMKCYDLDDFEIGPDGSFEILAGPEPRPGNWIRLEPDTRVNTITVRAAMYDWENEVPPHFQVDATDAAAGQPIVHDEAEIIRRLVLSADSIKYCISRWTTRGSPRLVKTFGMNNFTVFRGDPAVGGASPLALYGQAAYEIGQDEALVVEAEWPVAKYWGISLGTWWWEATNPTHHTSSINGHQAVRDSDGKFRAVIAHRDPGIANWLDPAGWETGVILFRWYAPAADYTVKTTKVPFADIERHLPADVARTTAEERRRIVERRKNGVSRWYGWRA